MSCELWIVLYTLIERHKSFQTNTFQCISSNHYSKPIPSGLCVCFVRLSQLPLHMCFKPKGLKAYVHMKVFGSNFPSSHTNLTGGKKRLSKHSHALQCASFKGVVWPYKSAWLKFNYKDLPQDRKLIVKRLAVLFQATRCYESSLHQTSGQYVSPHFNFV